MNNHAYLDALGNALDYEDNEAFILTAFGPKRSPKARDLPSPEDAIIAVIRNWSEEEKWRAVRVVTALADPS
jgi:hypothetical protein